MIGTTFNVTLMTQQNSGEYESFTYKEGRVNGPGWSFTDPITMDDVKGVRKSITKFIDLVLHNCAHGPNGDRQETGLEIHEIPEAEGVPATITFEFTVGSLIASMVYDKAANTFTGEQSAFDIVWCDFIAYVKAWDKYLEVVEARDFD